MKNRGAENSFRLPIFSLDFCVRSLYNIKRCRQTTEKRKHLSGCGEVWYRACFGSKRPRVRIPTLRPCKKPAGFIPAGFSYTLFAACLDEISLVVFTANMQYNCKRPGPAKCICILRGPLFSIGVLIIPGMLPAASQYPDPTVSDHCG